MSALPPIRPDLELSEGYHSPQVEAEVRLNTNESPFPPPPAWSEELLAALSEVSFHRYPDRPATELRAAIAALHEVTPAEVFCANGSNEVLQSLMLAYGGPGRRACMFEPTYALHSHISRIVGTEVIRGDRDEDFLISVPDAVALLAESSPDVTFLCSPNNPTGRAEPRATVEAIVEAAPGLVVVDEAYGQFAPWSALSLRGL
ncbi:MAG TPA: aminotransferase class I/II-fold pyridoxal phosphate-dependent enzyme, partial [Acidimicrobiales bacterium]